MGSARSVVALAVGVLAGCATASGGEVVAEGDEEISITAYETVPETQPLSGSLMGFRMEPVEGASCELRNDRGTWSVVTPARVRVLRSLEPLEFECKREGYGSVRGKLKCLTTAQRNAPGDTLAIFQLFTFGPLAIAAAPVAPGIAMQAGSQALFAGAELAVSRASASSARHACSYLGVHAPMSPLPERKP